MSSSTAPITGAGPLAESLPSQPERFRVLLVDDEPDILESLEYWLTENGFEVSTAQTCERALHLGREEEWDLVVTDIRMPQGDGRNLVELLNRDQTTRPVIFTMSAYHDMSLAEVYERGIDLALEKPVNMHALVQAARHFLRTREERLKQRERMSQTLPFLAGLGHDLKTPVSAIVGYASLLRATVSDDSARRYANSIMKSADVLVALVNDFLGLVELQHELATRPLEPFSVRPLLESIMETARAAHSRNDVSPVLTVGPEVPAVLAGPTLRIQQLVSNIVSNSFKYTEQGMVSVRAGLHQNGEHPTLVIEVADTGCGMPPDQLERLGTPFLRLPDFSTAGTEGHGLGLYTVRRILELMGGKWSVTSAPGAGTTFVLHIPVQRASSH